MPEFNEAKAKQFGNRMLEVLNSSSLGLMTSIGHRTGLFDTMAKLPPSTSEAIARAAELNERYVREWLGAMTTGKFVEHNPESGTYTLPPEHAAYLTRDAGQKNIGSFTQYFSFMGEVEDRIVECFRNGGGVPYSAFPRFQKIMAEGSTQVVVSALLPSILPLIPGLSDRLKQGIDVADVGCGSGRALSHLASTFPASRFTGYDISEEGIERGRAEARSNGLTNVRFELQDGSKLDVRNAYDFIMVFDAIHDQARPDLVLKAIARALRNDGTFLMQDIKASSRVEKNMSHPLGPFLYSVSTMHCMTVSLAVGGMGLGTMWGREKAEEMLREAGFSQIEVRELSHDINNDFYVIQKG